jgi:hypothetical protein
MAISQQDYFKLPTESIDQYNTRITSLRSSQPATPQPSQLPSDLPSLQKIVDQASQTVQGLASQVQARVQPITNPVPANTIKPVITPSLPEPKAPSVISNFVGGIQQNLETTRKAFEDSVKAERDNLDKQRKQYETQIADFNTKEQNTIQNDVQPLLQPFRQDLEKNERERLKVEENYFENQKIVNEIQTLANGLQQDIATVQDVAAPAAIQEGKIGKIKEDSLARIGVLQAVVSMRNGQISTALNFIDRSSEAIVADRQDRLNYFNTLLNFYEGQKDDTGKKLLDVEAKDLGYVKTQIGLLENDLNTAQSSFNNIKNMMLDPAKADILARSGVKLTDTPNQVAQKISTYNYTQEKQDLQNQMALKGYSLLPFSEQTAGKDPSSLLRVVDSKGNEMVFYNPSATSTTGFNFGTGTVAQRNNNPGNIKVSSTTLEMFKDLGANASSTQATDGGSFLQFPTAEAGFQAMGRLLKSGIYANMRVGDALSKWSNGGYGANIANAAGVDPNAFVRDLPAGQLQSLTQAMAKQEGFYNGGTSPQVSAIQNGLNALLTRFSSKDERNAVNSTVASAVNRGDIETAKQTLIANAIGTLGQEQQTKAIGRIQATEQLDRIQSLLNEYQTNGGNTSLLKGTEEKILQKIGKTGDANLARIGNEIQTAIIAYRNAVSGAAFTESEMKQYDAVFPSTKKEYTLNSSLIASLKSSFNTQQEALLATVLGGRENYNALFGQQPSSNPTQSTQPQNAGTTSSGLSWSIVQ